jgi:ABC-type multidrug transport system ATPase subunit
MQQRVAITRALLHDPKLLLMDEPFAALDALTLDRLSVELQSILMQHRKPVLFVTHSIPEALFLADRVLVMSARPGRLLASFEITEPRPRGIDAAYEHRRDRRCASTRTTPAAPTGASTWSVPISWRWPPRSASPLSSPHWTDWPTRSAPRSARTRHGSCC